MRTMVLAALGWLAAAAAGAQDGSNGPGIENVARPAGTFLSYHPLGGRMVTFHRGYLYIMGQAKTTLWDVSSFTDPVVLDIKEIGDNGHRWWKFNTDMFWREYTTPEVDGSGYHFLDMSNMFDLKPWTDPSVPMPIEEGGQQLQFEWQALETWPTGTNGGNVHDARYDNPQEGGITSTFDTASLGVNSMLRFRIGNLLFITAPNGLAVLDIGDPKNVVFLDSIICDCEQYTTTYHVWGDHLVVLNGNNNNEGGNNLVTIDFSDPTDLKLGSVALPVEVVSAGRYMYFQDEYGFAGQDAFGVKVDMRTGEIVQRFDAPGPWPQTFLDYQWMPLGAVVVSSGSNSDDGKTFFYQHQDQPDTRGPTIRFHHPFADSTNNPVSTVIGFAIPEIIDERTANNDTIILRPVGGGEPIPADFIWSSYQVLNMVPRRLLDPDTTYEVRFVAGGLKDVAGNGIEEYSFFFSTGNALNPNTAPKVEAVEYGGDGPVALGQSVTFTAVASDFENDPIEYRWNVDGGANTAWSSDNRLTVGFDTLGVHSVTVQVRDNQGGLSAFSRNVVVVSSTTPSTATQSAPLALDAVGRKVWVVNPDNDTVTAVHADTLAKIGEYPVCAHPSSVAVDGHGQVWVACRDADQVQVLDSGTGASVSVLELPYGAQPYGLVVDPAGDHVYVGLAGRGAVTRIDAAARSVGPSVSLGPQVRALAISPDGSRLLATRFISPDDGGQVWEVDLATFTLSRTFTLPLDSTTPDSGNAGRGLPNYLASVAFSPDGGRAIVVGKKDNILRGLARDGNPLTFETTVRNTIATLDMATGSERVDERLDIDNHAQPSAVTFSPLGTHVFIAMQGNNRVVVLDATSGREVGRVDVGPGAAGRARRSGHPPRVRQELHRAQPDGARRRRHAGARRAGRAGARHRDHRRPGAPERPAVARPANLLQRARYPHGLRRLHQLLGLPQRRRRGRPRLGLHRPRRRAAQHHRPARPRRHRPRARALERQLRRDPGFRARHPRPVRRHRLHERRRLQRRHAQPPARRRQGRRLRRARRPGGLCRHLRPLRPQPLPQRRRHAHHRRPGRPGAVRERRLRQLPRRAGFQRQRARPDARCRHHQAAQRRPSGRGPARHRHPDPA
ncbi:MAG: hypothetical protein KatS3mg121_0987 [Gammaproteobacteria bacterium]|nr:MAG: hypothetical protein KatS3mg121_0987 [Gammaproteobacteria bacterium]